MKKINLNHLITNKKNMKNSFKFTKAIAATLLLLLITTLSQATTVTVDNNADSGAQYTDLQPAIDAVQAGDTILVAGSANAYAGVTTKKKITLIGAGYVGLSSKLNHLFFENLTAADGSSGSLVSGFEITSVRFNTFYTNRVSDGFLSDITIERCQLSGIQFSNNLDNYSNFLFRNNIIKGSNNFNVNNTLDATFSSIVYSNNIFDAGFFLSTVSVSISNGVEFIHSAQSMNGVIIRNNMFIGSNFTAFNEVIGSTVENNIFYGRSLIPIQAFTDLDTLKYNLNFNNNITYLSAQDLTENSWFAVGANNSPVDPLYVNFPPDGAAFSIEHDYRLQMGSPAIGAGVNEENLGIYGGAYPWPGDLVIFPKGPRVTELEPLESPSVPAGSTLDIQFKSIIDN